MAGALMVNDTAFANYRIVYDILPGNGPVAVINASTIAGDIPLAVNFNSGGSIALVTYAWNFGDGGTATAPNPSHTFTVAGEYLVTLTTADEFGRQTTQAQMINATKPNQIPVAIATADKYSGNAPLDVVLSAAKSYDPDGVIGNIEWLFSDGGSYWGSTAYHTFTTVGTHTVTLRCYDARGGIGTTLAAGEGHRPIGQKLRLIQRLLRLGEPAPRRPVSQRDVMLVLGQPLHVCPVGVQVRGDSLQPHTLEIVEILVEVHRRLNHAIVSGKPRLELRALGRAGHQRLQFPPGPPAGMLEDPISPHRIAALQLDYLRFEPSQRAIDVLAHLMQRALVKETRNLTRGLRLGHYVFSALGKSPGSSVHPR